MPELFLVEDTIGISGDLWELISLPEYGPY